MTFQVKATTTGKLRYRVVQEFSDAKGYEAVPLTRWCGSIDGARKAKQKAQVPRA